MSICTVEDEFIKGKAIWIAELEDGTKVYQDDDRPDEEVPNAWIRLRQYVQENKKNVKAIYLRFWDHIEKVAENADGFYYIRSVGAFHSDDRTIYHYVIGTYDKNTDMVSTIRWLVPEIIEFNRDVRKVEHDDLSLIINHG